MYLLYNPTRVLHKLVIIESLVYIEVYIDAQEIRNYDLDSSYYM